MKTQNPKQRLQRIVKGNNQNDLNRSSNRLGLINETKRNPFRLI